MKWILLADEIDRYRRSPHGERGLKSLRAIIPLQLRCRSPHGERGLKLYGGVEWVKFEGRSPHGERGLK